MKTIALLASLASSACLFGEVSGIPCKRDDACPETYFCDIPRAECREVTDSFGPPALVVPLVLDPQGEEVRTPFLPPDVTSTISLLPTNEGLSPAEGLRLSFADLDCFTFDVDSGTEPVLIEPGERGVIDFDITPGPGCDGLTIVDWFITFSGRETRGIFDVNVNSNAE